MALWPLFFIGLLANVGSAHGSDRPRHTRKKAAHSGSAAIREIIQKIDDNIIDDTFFAGEKLVKDAPNDEREEVGGCILDKVVAIAKEAAHREHLKELKQDVAACCTKGSQADCVTDLEEGYGILERISENCAHQWHFWEECYDKQASSAATSFLKAVQKRLRPDRLSPKAAVFISRCAYKPLGCIAKVPKEADEKAQQLDNAQSAGSKEHQKQLTDFEAAKESDQKAQEPDDSQPARSKGPLKLDGLEAWDDTETEAQEPDDSQPARSKGPLKPDGLEAQEPDDSQPARSKGPLKLDGLEAWDDTPVARGQHT